MQMITSHHISQFDNDPQLFYQVIEQCQGLRCNIMIMATYRSGTSQITESARSV